jgi:hypothetical protein
MRDSLLSPRDPILAWGQIAQGAVVGACIGLFITPSGAGPLVPLTPSALSFIADSVSRAYSSCLRASSNACSTYLNKNRNSSATPSATGLGCVETDSPEAAVVDNRCRPPMLS